MKLFNFRTGREINPENRIVIADLDALMADSVWFKWEGRLHEIRPMNLKSFMRVMNKYADLLNGKTKSDTTTEELYTLYGHFFSEVCPTIGPAEVAKMSVPQVAALFNYVVNTITGKAQAEDAEKKKNLTQSQSSPVS
jgi:hypothetical protein